MLGYATWVALEGALAAALIYFEFAVFNGAVR